MSSTCPYILAKTSQLFTAARITSQSENFKEGLTSNKIVQRIAKLQTNLKSFHVDTGEYLPPGFSLKGFSSAANYLYVQFTENKLVQSVNDADYRLTEYIEDVCGHRTNVQPACTEHLTVKDKDIARKKTEKYFETFGISDDELLDCMKEIKNMKKRQWLLEQNEHKTEHGWVKFLQQKDLLVWRRPMNENGLYQYKVFGSFFDISSESFFNSQIDLQYRKSWDKYAISLDIIDKSLSCGSEVVHWVTRFPYPLKSRDYVFVRRYKMDISTKTMILVSRASNHSDCPESPEHIRVKDYASQMVVQPHRTFHEPGFDYVLTYHDDSRVNVPSFCVNMITGSAVPDFVKTLHDAAAMMEGQR